jgi:hypothetical protein
MFKLGRSKLLGNVGRFTVVGRLMFDAMPLPPEKFGRLFPAKLPVGRLMFAGRFMLAGRCWAIDGRFCGTKEGRAPPPAIEGREIEGRALPPLNDGV